MPLPSNAKLSDVIAKLQALTGINQIPELKEALQTKGIMLTGNETMVDLAKIIIDNNFNLTVDATAVPSDIRSGMTAYVNGEKIMGTLPVQTGGAITPGAVEIVKPAGIYDTDITVKGVIVPTDKVLTGTTIAGQAGAMPNLGSKVITPGTVNQAISIGYHNGGGYVAGDPNLNASNIKSGVSIFGIAGNLVDTAEQHGIINIPANSFVNVTTSFDIRGFAAKGYGVDDMLWMTTDFGSYARSTSSLSSGGDITDRISRVGARQYKLTNYVVSNVNWTYQVIN
ncbi:hypothetical protein [Paenibacillus sp. AR247]|uniref:hypothetical protein n=1 Tax=Paenibacillus sp. AR247 TaxID=1631599 RepID=UPI000CF8AC28|nr:hypothetical protein [Paenibacillus sp. AR247]PQP90777.1 hypothetical protein CPT76_04280 [Paenibacillus sp. AR247]